MTESELEIAFEMMGSRLKGFGPNKSAPCPLAPWTHKKGVDKNPSLTVIAGDVAVFKCWSCQEQGTVKKLTRMYSECSGDSRAYDFVRNLEGDNVSLFKAFTHKYGDRTSVGKKIYKKDNSKPITEDAAKKFLREVPEYAFERGLTKDQILKWEIGYDVKLSRMTVPVRDLTGKFCGVSGRDVTGKQQPKWKHYSGLRKEQVFYGEHFLDRSVKRGYVVEGFSDVWYLDRLKCKNPLASMGTSLSMDQMRKLVTWFDEVIFIPDCDDGGAGLRFCEESCEHLLLSSGIKVGVAGTMLNNRFIKRSRPRKWENIDYRLEPISEIKGKDPADFSREDMREALLFINWFTVKDGGIEIYA